VTRVVDASIVVSALVDSGPAGVWAEAQLEKGSLAAPHLMLVEGANILRRAVLCGDISADAGTLAHADLAHLRVELFPYEPFADRVWELRANLTAYDAWYVAVAEALGAELITLDGRLARATGPRCTIVTPPDGVLAD